MMAFLRKEPRLQGTIGWRRNKKENFEIGSMDTKETIAILPSSRKDAEENTKRLVSCWNHCQGLNPSVITEMTVFMFALPNLLKDSSQLPMIQERLQELLSQAKETQ